MHRTSRLIGLTALAVAAILLAACDDDQPSTRAAVEGTQVRVVDNDFDPEHLEVAAGDVVTWTWGGNAPHDVVGDDFESEVQREGTFSHTFDAPGSYDYRCTLHAGMTGRVTVVDG